MKQAGMEFEKELVEAEVEKERSWWRNSSARKKWKKSIRKYLAISRERT